ncbi:MAG: flagellar basal body P-ring formation protein FlgA [Alphaproteobacteria bacterium]|nr:MAG: flagellar basal body P-ring formation protein FlgA [Alphaproteobacteria bacterium]
MKHITLTLTFLIAFLAPALAFGEETVTLRQNITVEGKEITVGDIFSGAGDKADVVVSASPAPGKSIIFKAVSVARFIHSKGLVWRPTSPVRRIPVRRIGVSVSQQVITDNLRAALEYESGEDLFEMQLATQALNIMVGTNETPDVSVENVFYNRKSGQFVAELLAPANADNGQRYKVMGTIHRQVMVPVLKHFTASGEEITAKDIEFKPERESKVGRGMITEADMLIGKSPRRAIRSGVPVNANNLGEPVMVAKGKLVAVVLQQGGLFLSVSGRTLEAGGKDDVIRVENIASRKIIQAQVVSAREVRIVNAQSQLAAVR